MQENIDILQTFVDHLPEGVLVIDESGNVIIYNEEALVLLETSVEDILLKPLNEIVSENELVLALKDAQVGKRSHVVLKNGKHILSCGIRKTTGLTGHGSQTIVSISDAQPLKRLSEIKKEFISAILHKIRSPLATLKTSLSVLHEYESEKMSDEAREVLEMGSHEVDRLSILLNSLRDLFTIETGLLSDNLTCELFDINKASENAIKKLALLHSNILSRVKIEGDLNTVVLADYHRFCRVLELVIDNAIIYSQDIINIVITQKQKHCSIQIKDYGIGISEENMPLIFTKYFREDNEITRSVQGNGLGLFIAQAWMQTMAGSVSCESVKDQGTTITLTIPIA